MLGVIDRLSGCALPERDPMGTLKKSISTYHRPSPTTEDSLGGKPPLSPRRSYSPVSLAPLSHSPPYPVPLAPDGVGCYVAFAVTSSEGECPVSVERHSAQKDEDGES